MFIQVSLIVGLEYGPVDWTMEFEIALFRSTRLCCITIYLLIHSEPALLCISLHSCIPPEVLGVKGHVHIQ